MKRRLNANPTTSSKRIYDEVINEERDILKYHLNQSQLSLSLPKFDDIRSSLHNVKRLHFPKQPSSCAELKLPNECTKINDERTMPSFHEKGPRGVESHDSCGLKVEGT